MENDTLFIYCGFFVIFFREREAGSVKHVHGSMREIMRDGSVTFLK